MVRFMFIATLGFLMTWAGSAVQADVFASLESFYSKTNSLKAQFTQTVYDEQAQVIDQSEGVMHLSRPGKFHWKYSQPLPQEIISDGNIIWLYDVELEQVTIRPYQQTLAGTPAELLAGRGDLRTQYSMQQFDAKEDAGGLSGLKWIALTPLTEDTQFIKIEIGFEQNKLKKMRLSDSFERITELEFHSLDENIALADSLFQFEIPPGVDVIDGTESFN